MKHYEIIIEGMGCANCVNKVKSALSWLGASVESCTIGKAIVIYDGSTKALREAVENCGFFVAEIRSL